MAPAFNVADGLASLLAQADADADLAAAALDEVAADDVQPSGDEGDGWAGLLAEQGDIVSDSDASASHRQNLLEDACASGGEDIDNPGEQAIVPANSPGDLALVQRWRQVTPAQAVAESKAALRATDGPVDPLQIGRVAGTLGILPPSAKLKGRRMFDTSTAPIVEHFVSHHVRSGASIATDVGESRKGVHVTRCRLGAACFHIESWGAFCMVKSLTETVLQQGGQLLTLTRRLRFDDPPLVVKGTSRSEVAACQEVAIPAAGASFLASVVSADVAPSKPVQFEWRGGEASWSR